MAASFEGWLESWRGWGSYEFDPNAMRGAASMTISAIGTLIADGVFDIGWSFARKAHRIKVPSKKRENDEAYLLACLI